MRPAPTHNSWLYLLERFDVGVVHLDQALRVVGMNDYARRSLPAGDPPLFLRVHRSYIVNLAQVDEIVQGDGRMLLRMIGSTPVEIPVSRACTGKLMEQLGLTDTATLRN